MEYWEVIGTIAAVLTSTSFLPQAIKTIKTKNTKAISLYSYLMFVTGVIFWLIYGLALESLPLILANAVTVTFAGIILIYKVREVVLGQ